MENALDGAIEHARAITQSFALLMIDLDCYKAAQELLDTLITLGCDYAQGYHIGWPVPPDALLHWWKTAYRQWVAQRAIASAPLPPSPLKVITR